MGEDMMGGDMMGGDMTDEGKSAAELLSDVMTEHRSARHGRLAGQRPAGAVAVAAAQIVFSPAEVAQFEARAAADAAAPADPAAGGSAA